ncbi:MAG: hypothetical protein FJY74_00370 [Candidatus Eisenbacteria bacterium]|nr:hypothetical protein [Candidatus Eisenbacteria bacterium]
MARTGFALAGAVAALCAVVQASAAPGGAARVSPTTAIVAGVAYPGLGQLVVGSELKAAAVGAAQAFLVGSVVLEDRWAREALRAHNETGSAADYEDYSRHYDRRTAFAWWALAVGLLSVADAYVDAHLLGFDEPLIPGRRDADQEALSGSGALRVGLAVRF